MTNIPRRKIYEEMLIFEDGIIEMQILLFNQENFDKFQSKFNKSSLKKIQDAYVKIKALLVMFTENRKYPLEGGFEEDFNKLILDESEIDRHIEENKNFKKEFKSILNKINKEVLNLKEISTFEEGKQVYKKLDDFNHIIPKLLEIRRDEMK